MFVRDVVLPQVCPKPEDKLRVLQDMVFPLVQKLGQTIIFVRTRETARALHNEVRFLRFNFKFEFKQGIQIRDSAHTPTSSLCLLLGCSGFAARFLASAGWHVAELHV